ncbi:aminotransferase class I/II-fold pyridoxal phosphate-dependent enzyme [Microbacterium sp. BG28]|uniref:MalY/PatB family protein n=1 Tax=Microbacterium sp. BG28 TaxID=3097356 RepID=UPI002A59BE32|nr:aminotransferase class I/II-fold pyridoxal phosphate-dependent enzyme [Microbacterium sp. BG28]MDY0829232.1 aminotransferase class I/II-fold pyridoxal phosphate-dependent enzyme [Microbacterium sp. BG28]
MTIEPLRALPLDELRQRRSAKWRSYPDDVIPLFVAETDYPLAPAISAALHEAVSRGDTGYTPADPGVTAAYSAFAARRLGWHPDPERMRITGDVIMGVVEILRRVIVPGDRVVVTPPVYPPFFEAVPEAGGVVQSVPLREAGEGWELDLEGIEDAFREGARALLLCNPHNPTGTIHPAAVLSALAEIAVRYGAIVVSDEIHAPLPRLGNVVTPFLSVSDAAAQCGYAVVSASKAFNLAGLKCAIMVAADDRTHAILRSLPDEVSWRTGLFGAVATVAALSVESDHWLDAQALAIDANVALLRALLKAHLRDAGFRSPQAGYLAWVDLSPYGWGDAPARRILREARVAVHSGPAFGAGGAGHIRLTLGCAPEVLTEAIERIAVLH